MNTVYQKFDLQDLEEIEGVLLGDLGQLEAPPETILRSRQQFDNVNQDFNFDAINYCLRRYVESELDLSTAGKRGMGRASPMVPRLAAYLRRGVASLGQAELIHLATLIRDDILRGYLSNFVLGPPQVSKAKNKKPTELFDEWMPLIYVTRLRELPEHSKRMLLICTDTSMERILGYLASKRISGGGLLRGDRTREILVYYSLGGRGLRLVEEGLIGNG